MKKVRVLVACATAGFLGMVVTAQQPSPSVARTAAPRPAAAVPS